MKSLLNVAAVIISLEVGIYLGEHKHSAWWVSLLVSMFNAIVCLTLIDVYANDKMRRKIYDRYSR